MIRKSDDCEDYSEMKSYDECVDHHIQQTLQPLLHCHPPWLSPVHHCTTLNLTENKEAYEAEFRQYVENALKMKPYPASEACKPACKITKSTVNLEARDHIPGMREGEVDINFVQTVVETDKITTYHWPEFLVDVGSSVGLWLGLSVFGVTDLLISFIENFHKFVKKSYTKLTHAQTRIIKHV